MTPMKYILSTGVCTTSELLQFNKQDPQGYKKLIEWAQDQAKNQGVALEAPPVAQAQA